MDSLKIRQENQKDHLAVYNLNQSAFAQPNEAKLVDALRKNKTAFVPSLSLVACINEEVVGHILLSQIHIEDNTGRKHKALALAPMAVLPSYQRKGIGQQLVQRALYEAKKANHHLVIVLGHANFYQKFGFKPAGNWQITPPFEVPNEVFMALALSDGALEDCSGMVIYPKEFLEM